MVTRRRERGLRERPRRDAVLLEKRAVQRPLDDQRPLRRIGELHDPIRIRRLRGGERQSTPKADEVVRILRDVMLEARLAQRAGRELRVEGHRADDLVDGDVLVPGLAREEAGSAHGDGVPETDRRAPSNATATFTPTGTPTSTVTATSTVTTTPTLSGHAYVANTNSANVSVIDTTTNAVVGMPITVGTSPQSVGVDTIVHRAYVANGGSSSVSVIDTTTNAVVGTPIPV